MKYEFSFDEKWIWTLDFFNLMPFHELRFKKKLIRYNSMHLIIKCIQQLITTSLAFHGDPTLYVKIYIHNICVLFYPFITPYVLAIETKLVSIWVSYRTWSFCSNFLHTKLTKMNSERTLVYFRLRPYMYLHFITNITKQTNKQRCLNQGNTLKWKSQDMINAKTMQPSRIFMILRPCQKFCGSLPTAIAAAANWSAASISVAALLLSFVCSPPTFCAMAPQISQVLNHHHRWTYQH